MDVGFLGELIQIRFPQTQINKRKFEFDGNLNSKCHLEISG